MTFDKKLLKSIEMYFDAFADDRFPLIYQRGQLRIYETFVGLDSDGCDIPSDNPRAIALLADKIYYKETLSNVEFLDCVKYSKELDLLRTNLIEYATNEFPIK